MATKNINLPLTRFGSRGAWENPSCHLNKAFQTFAESSATVANSLPVLAFSRMAKGRGFVQDGIHTLYRRN